MTATPLMPLGYIDDSNEQGGSFTMARPDDVTLIIPGVPILIRNEDIRFEATALMRGEITEVTGRSASFIIFAHQLDPGWPEHLDPKGAGNPVYLGIPGTYHPDFNRGFATKEEFHFLMEMAEQHHRDTGISPRRAVYVPVAEVEEELL